MQAGELIAGRYRLDDRIDGGAMGDVWRGHDTRLNRTVAIKLLRSGLSDNARFRARFQHEAQAVASLQAPGVVSLYDYGEESTSDGIVSYLIMELVKGRSLASILDERRTLSVPDTMRLIAGAADALHAAHYAGIVHRDVKPGNMLVGGDGNVTIVDFGIARARGEAGLTETGMVMGTLSYCSPEQLCDRDLTPASDVYSLGIVAYECLSGRVPFPSGNPGAAINGHLHQNPPPLPQHVPGAVRDVVMMALEKDPHRRWRSAADFADACRAAASGRRTGATPVTRPPTEATRVMASPPMTPPPAYQRYDTGPMTTATHRRETGPIGPPREPEKDKGRAGIAVAVTAVLAGMALLVGLLIFRPWESAPDAVADDPTATTQASPSEDDSQEPDDDNESTEPDDDETSSSQAPPTGTIPAVNGQMIDVAAQSLGANGFQNVEFLPNNATVEDPAACIVESVYPGEGSTVDLTTPVQVYYVGTAEQCGR